MSKHIIKYNYYWKGYPTDIINFLIKNEICLTDYKIQEIKPSTRIIIDQGPKFRYMHDMWEIPNDLLKNIDYK